MLSKKTKYAINALVYLAKKPPKEPVLISEIAEHEHIPKKFLETILLDLRNAGILNSKKGKGGGYYLIKHPADVNLAEIVRYFDGAIGLLPCVTHKYYEKCAECDDEVTCGIRHAFLQIRNDTVELLKKDTLEKIIKNEEKLKKMLTNDTLKFLKELSKNNNKEWFEKNRKRYDTAQTEIKNFLAAWINNYGKKDESIAHLDPKKCIFRINRDVRFSADKSPYKTNLGAYLTKGGKNTNLAGFYLHIEPNNCFFGAGNYMPMPDQLAKIRQEIDYNFTDFNKIIAAKKFKENFGELSIENKLKRPPKGYEESNEAIEYLKLKGFTVFKKIKDDELTSNDFVKTVTELSVSVKPFVDFLNSAVE